MILSIIFELNDVFTFNIRPSVYYLTFPPTRLSHHSISTE